MIRNDFVSNSSSSSFIINDCNKIKIDDRFLKILKSIESYVTFSYDRILPSEIKELIEKNDKFKPMEYSRTYEVEVNDPSTLDKTDLDILKQLFKTCNRVYCSCGEDYEYNCLTAQICTLLEIYYGIIPEGNDHFDYESIQKILNKEI